MDTQEFITGLIQQIQDAEIPESVTNTMVARILEFLNTNLAEVRKGQLSGVEISTAGMSGGRPSHPKLFLYRQGSEPLSVAFPLASDSEAGLMTAEQAEALEKVIEDVVTALGTAEGMAVTKLEFFNMEDGHYGAIGLSQGGKAAASVMIPHATTERSGLMCRGQAIHLDELYKDMPGVKTAITEAHSKAETAQATAAAATRAAERAAVEGLVQPRFSGEVIDGVPHGASVLNQGIGMRSDSPGCAVVFDKSCNRFLLRVREAGVMFPTFYTMWVDAASMGLTQDMDPELPRLYKASPGVAYLATEPPYGLYFLGEGMADLIPGTQIPDSPLTDADKATLENLRCLPCFVTFSDGGTLTEEQQERNRLTFEALTAARLEGTLHCTLLNIIPTDHYEIDTEDKCRSIGVVLRLLEDLAVICFVSFKAGSITTCGLLPDGTFRNTVVYRGVPGTIIEEDKLIAGREDGVLKSVSLKTINGESLLGTGDIDLSGYVKGVVMTEAEYEALGGQVSEETLYFLTEDDQA